MIFIRHMYRHVWRLGSDKKKGRESGFFWIGDMYKSAFSCGAV
jgi:hypothetical protein